TVRRLARRFEGRGEPLEDLVQAGMVGLIKAVDRFELSRGLEFTTYAVPNVIGEIKRHFRDRTWAVRVPRALQELTVRLPGERERLTRLLGREPTIAELAESLAVEPEQLLEAVEAGRAYKAISLTAPAPGSEDETESGGILDQLGDDDPAYEHCDNKLALRTRADPVPDRSPTRLLADAHLEDPPPRARQARTRPARKHRRLASRAATNVARAIDHRGVRRARHGFGGQRAGRRGARAERGSAVARD